MLLARRDFLLIFLALGLSSLGDYAALTTLMLRMEDTGSGWLVALLLLTNLVPAVLLSPFAGLLVDRVETVRVLVGTALFQAVVALGLALVTDPGPTLALSFLLGAGVATTQPALFALLPRAVGEERTTEANAFLEAARWGGAAVGPVLAAVMRSTLGGRAALIANAGTFMLVAILIPLLRVRRMPAARPDRASRRRGQAR